MSEARPFPKSAQLARGERRYRRKVASPKQWQAIAAAKMGPCRVCEARGVFVPSPGWMQLHHLVARAHGGADTAANIVPLCSLCHSDVTGRNRDACEALLSTLADDEYAYCVSQGGEDYFERAYGIVYARVGVV